MNERIISPSRSSNQTGNQPKTWEEKGHKINKRRGYLCDSFSFNRIILFARINNKHTTGNGYERYIISLDLPYYVGGSVLVHMPSTFHDCVVFKE